MRPLVLAIPALTALLALAACKSKADQNEAMLMPKPPPPGEAVVPASLQIPVELEGKPAQMIDAKLLNARKPDFQDQEHRAWSIAALIGEPADRSDSVFTVIGESNFRVAMPHPKKPQDPVPVLMLSRRGEITAAMVKPDEPFPAFHGQGRRLERGGDPLPRVAKSVAKIIVGYGETAQESPPLEIVLDGKAAAPWTAAQVRATGAKTFATGDAARASWSLRDLVHALVGPKARVAVIAGAGQRRLTIDRKAWDDAAQTPTLRVNRQGLFKFQWVGDRTKLPAEEELRNVHTLEVVSE